MPELPEVETVRRELEPWLAGRRIVRARRGDAPPGPKYRDLERADGREILAVTRRGKFLVLPLDGGDELVIHLGMTGTLTPVPPADHLRVRVTLEGPAPNELHFRDPRRFGRFLVLRGGDRAALPTLAALGPEPTDPDTFTVAALRRGLRGRAPVKALLLSQRPVAGLGNIYVDEALWRARIHPETAARAVADARVRELHRAIVEVIADAIAHRGTTISDYRTVSGGSGGFAGALMAYGRTGEPCARCGTPIARIVAAQRGTHFCPRCQRRRS
ncbi:MAG: bifunctional DNA-formamidopyrimidine glycosylase/DNA-(apurinic or apyrimidinic site) lyase [Myxococcales bacterium]|nr:bifunctional DNA-formamidopyrimidine glycosylase/DNA-(apurinic or apyrimidinic site) lyase [Myxococcales bacterium]MCB9733585.1 bifunctional DNA-formamidopyrimidine glycosylase/DNA-(apurinic or apyrimidinic site) lyase [Deltaproteobacteria bacterium]